MGKSKKVTVGFWYGLGIQMGVCVGPVDKFLKVYGGGLQAWSGEVTQSQDIQIRARNLYGGEKKEGGIDGTLSVCMGEADQNPHPYLVEQLGLPQPGYRGLLTLVFRGLVGAMNPYIKPMTFQVARWVKGWRTEVWEPGLAQIDKGMNPAHYIYRAITDPVTGRGLDPNTALDLVRNKEAAQILHDEGLGLCLKWSRSDVVNNFIGIVCDHVGGEFSTDPKTNKQFLRLYRGGYDVNALPVIDETNILELSSHEQAALYGSTNTITVTYRDCETNKDANVTVHNPANIQAQGQVIPKPISYPGIWNEALAVRVATRELHAVSSLPARGKVKLPTPFFANVAGVTKEVEIMKGDILALSWKLLYLVRMPIRVLEIDRGGPTDNAIEVTYTTDVNALPTQNYVVGQPSLWVPTDTTPLPVPDQRLIESSYRDLAGTMRAADLAIVSNDAGYVGSLGIRPSSIAYNYTLQTRPGATGTFVERASGDFAPTGLLSAAIDDGHVPISVVLSSTRGLDLVSIGSEVLIDNELFRLDAINAETGAVTLARGCVDTLPAAHSAGARVWFTDDFTGADPTEYLAGEVVQAKLLTRTTAGELDLAFAPIAETTLSRRQARPYPPVALTVGGSSSPGSIQGKIVVGWVHRDRLLQADQLVDATQPSIGPEPGTSYTVRTYLDETLVESRTGISASTYTTALNMSGAARIEVVSVRDSLSSWQTAKASFDYVATLALLGDAPDTRVGQSYVYQYAATGGQPPYRWGILSGALPDGLVLDADNGSLAGTSTAVGKRAFQVQVTDQSGQSVPLADTIDVASSTAVKARYWRLLILANNGDRYFSVCKLRLLDLDGNSLTSPGDAATRASADSQANDQNMAAYAFGTDLGQKWASLPTAAPHWLQWDFGVGTPVYSVEVVGQYNLGDQAAGTPRDFRVQCSDDAQAWTDVLSVTGETNWGGAEGRRFFFPDGPVPVEMLSSLPFAGADGSTSFPDEKGVAWTRSGSLAITTAYDDGTGKGIGAQFGVNDSTYLQTSSSSIWYLGSGDFAMEAYVRMTGAFNSFNPIIGKHVTNAASSGQISFLFGMNGHKLSFQLYTAGGTVAVQDPDDFPVGTRTHVEVDRKGSTLYLFVQGVLKATASIGTAAAKFDPSIPVTMGHIMRTDGIEPGLTFNGVIEKMKFWNGAVHTIGFTPL